MIRNFRKLGFRNFSSQPLIKEHNYDGESLTQDQILSGDFQNIKVNGQPITDFIDVKNKVCVSKECETS